MTTTHETLDHTFSAPIGVDVKGEVWPCVEVPDARGLFGSLRAVRVDATVDGVVTLPNIGLMPTGGGSLMLSLSARVRRTLGKDVGDVVTVHLARPA
ncbi:uncharacterized protein DUF1905 [Isoptericola jiangsuensis]|uniref:Uncharacterized protein DUF1905 n=1 Tax=Isoptericola jiangsuensis TaxID=548579 RepID=A0A2A9EY55_9MICO|nr:DUF1905 domain-containing protein [Isoptericola jiangsuensis]PFG43155.1 uncharacterized protein DUF1905 [Isoptericola jiangsuensis]